MKLPARKSAHVEPQKVEYLLDVDTGKGGFFRRFDFRQHSLRDALLKHAQDFGVDLTRETGWGTRHELTGPLPAPDERAPTVRTVWQMEEGRPRLVTAFPD